MSVPSVPKNAHLESRKAFHQLLSEHLPVWQEVVASIREVAQRMQPELDLVAQGKKFYTRNTHGTSFDPDAVVIGGFEFYSKYRRPVANPPNADVRRLLKMDISEIEKGRDEVLHAFIPFTMLSKDFAASAYLRSKYLNSDEMTLIPARLEKLMKKIEEGRFLSNEKKAEKAAKPHVDEDAASHSSSLTTEVVAKVEEAVSSSDSEDDEARLTFIKNEAAFYSNLRDNLSLWQKAARELLDNVATIKDKMDQVSAGKLFFEYVRKTDPYQKFIELIIFQNIEGDDIKKLERLNPEVFTLEVMKKHLKTARREGFVEFFRKSGITAVTPKNENEKMILDFWQIHVVDYEGLELIPPSAEKILQEILAMKAAPKETAKLAPEQSQTVTPVVAASEGVSDAFKQKYILEKAKQQCQLLKETYPLPSESQGSASTQEASKPASASSLLAAINQKEQQTAKIKIEEVRNDQAKRITQLASSQASAAADKVPAETTSTSAGKQEGSQAAAPSSATKVPEETTADKTKVTIPPTSVKEKEQPKESFLKSILFAPFRFLESIWNRFLSWLRS